MGGRPKAQAPTTEERAMRRRQTEELARLDDEENRRVKALARQRLGTRSLLGGADRAQSAATTPTTAPRPTTMGTSRLPVGVGRIVRPKP